MYCWNPLYMQSISCRWQLLADRLGISNHGSQITFYISYSASIPSQLLLNFSCPSVAVPVSYIQPSINSSYSIYVRITFMYSIYLPFVYFLYPLIWSISFPLLKAANLSLTNSLSKERDKIMETMETLIYQVYRDVKIK